jgi:hypothetical protein
MWTTTDIAGYMAWHIATSYCKQFADNAEFTITPSLPVILIISTVSLAAPFFVLQTTIVLDRSLLNLAEYHKYPGVQPTPTARPLVSENGVSLEHRTKSLAHSVRQK